MSKLPDHWTNPHHEPDPWFYPGEIKRIAIVLLAFPLVLALLVGAWFAFKFLINVIG